jgi:hypothetical protein
MELIAIMIMITVMKMKMSKKKRKMKYRKITKYKKKLNRKAKGGKDNSNPRS